MILVFSPDNEERARKTAQILANPGRAVLCGRAHINGEEKFIVNVVQVENVATQGET